MKQLFISFIIILFAATLLVLHACRNEKEPIEPVLDQSQIELNVNGESSISISKGVSPYTISVVDNSVATASVSENIITIKGIRSGKTIAEVKGADGGITGLSITIASPINPTLNPTNTLLVINRQDTVTVSGGVRPYTINVVDKTIASAFFKNDTIIITGMKSGTTTAEVKGADNGFTSFPITVVDPVSPNLDKEYSQVTVNLKDTIVISGGVAPYTVTVANKTIASASLNMDTITITGIKSGTTIAEVKGADGGLTNFPITVVNPINPTLDKTSINVTVNLENTVTISGGIAPYSVIVADKTVASASLINNTLTIKGLKSGTTTATVKSADNGSATLSITVAEPVNPTLDKTSINVTVNLENTVTISGGIAPYSVIVADKTVASASLINNTLTIKGLKSGTTTATVKGADGGSSNLPITVVNAVNPALDKMNIKVPISLTRTILISEGVAPYTVNVANKTIASASISTNTITVTGIKSGTTTAEVKGADGGITTFSIFVPTPVNPTLDKTIVNLSTNLSNSVLISEGVAPYTVEIANKTIASALVNNSIITITGISNGTTTAVVKGADGGTASFSINVSEAPVLSLDKINISVAEAFLLTIISNGSEPYNVTVEDGSVASVSFTTTNDIHYILVRGSNIGNTNLVVSNNAGGTTTCPIVVGNPVYHPSSLVVEVGKTATTGISGGTTPYNFNITNNTIASVSGVDSKIHTVTGIKSGSTNIATTDAGGRLSILPVKVADKVIGLNSQILTFENVTSYSVSNKSIIAASKTGSTLTLKGISLGGTTVTITDGSGTKTYSIEVVEFQEIDKAIYDKQIDNSEDQTFNYLGDKPALIMFQIPGCPYCKKIEPILKELVREYQGKFYFYKLDRNKDAALMTQLNDGEHCVVPAVMLIKKSATSYKIIKHTEILDANPFYGGWFAKNDVKAILKKLIEEELLR